MTRQATALKARIDQAVSYLLKIHSVDPDQRSREQVLNALLLGALALTFGALIVVLSNLIFLRFTHLAPRIIVIGLLLAGMIGLYILFRRGNYKLPTYSLLGLYFCAALAVLYQWGANNPMGLLLCVLVVISAGILLGSRYAVIALLVVIGTLAAITGLVATGTMTPDVSWTDNQTTFYDIIAFGIILANVTIASWLFNRSMEQSLERARRSEKALRRQKDLLEKKVEERTRQAQAAQLERIQELYRFAELGHMSVALLHDLANYLTVLSLDIEDLKQTRKDRSAVVRRVQQSIHHLDNLIGQVRLQIKGDATIIRFNIADEITHIMKVLEYKADSSRVVLAWDHPPNRKKLFYDGSINHFWQIIMNILSNGIDAYDRAPSPNRTVRVAARSASNGMEIQITDFGKGIAPQKIDKIFEPFYSTKKAGSGIGLAIAKRMVEKDFGGIIKVTSTKREGTIFTVILPYVEQTIS